MWGQAWLVSSFLISLAIIPTRVGTSIHQDEATPHLQDHPHACGDKYTFKSKELERTGSSPRVWGQAACDLLHYAYAGIIPTRVGTSAVCRSYFTSREDHPHACGDKFLQLFFQRHSSGSSPRVWGQVFDIFSAAIATGIIPTRVGTRTADYSSDALSRDHPHACGDKLS